MRREGREVETSRRRSIFDGRADSLNSLLDYIDSSRAIWSRVEFFEDDAKTPKF